MGIGRGMGIDSVLSLRTGRTGQSLYRYGQGHGALQTARFTDASQETTLASVQASAQSAVFPQMTVSRMDLSPTASLWNRRIPSKALFYDEVDQVSRGYRDKGVLFDAKG